ncbi:hypothetical protein FS749_000012 [Ceratobasidium sp. UAMH 11750]|nr:hypothetical protein FS749_000012 [Ceratobasidium sp. UAMH 11750]
MFKAPTRVLIDTYRLSYISIRHIRPVKTSAMASASVQDIPSRSQPLNVLGQPLQKCSTSRLTGFFRDGYCRTDVSDRGQHTIAAVVSDSFLDFSASRGNDLATPRPPSFEGLTEGCRWCLCVSRWKEALLAYRAGDIRRDAVPR